MTKAQRWPLIIAASVSIMALSSGLFDIMVATANEIQANASAANAQSNQLLSSMTQEQQQNMLIQNLLQGTYAPDIIPSGAYLMCYGSHGKWIEQELPVKTDLHTFSNLSMCIAQESADNEASEAINR